MKIKNWKKFNEEFKGNLEDLDLTLSKSDANKLWSLEEDNVAPGEKGFTEKEYKKFIKKVTGMTLSAYAEWIYPDEPEEQIKLAKKVLKK